MVSPAGQNALVTDFARIAKALLDGHPAAPKGQVELYDFLDSVALTILGGAQCPKIEVHEFDLIGTDFEGHEDRLFWVSRVFEIEGQEPIHQVLEMDGTFTTVEPDYMDGAELPFQFAFKGDVQ